MTIIYINQNLWKQTWLDLKENWTSKWWFCCCVDYSFTASHSTTLVTMYFCSCSHRNEFPSANGVYSEMMLNHSSVTTHIQPTEKEWECCLLNLGCMYKTLQSCSVPWSQNSRSIHASKIQEWDLQLGTWESTGTLVSEHKPGNSHPSLSAVSESVILHLNYKNRVQQWCSRHKITHRVQKPQESRGSR